MRTNAKTTENRRASRPTPRQRSHKRNKQVGAAFTFPAPQLANAPALALSLPSIASVPTKLVYQKSVEATARIALAFLDRGMAIEEDAASATTPALFIEQIFKRWIAEKTSDLKNLSPQFCIADTLEAYSECDGDKKTPQVTVGISFSHEAAEYYTMRAKIETLETSVPGLGQTALSHLYAWLCRTTLSLSPDFILSLVQHHYWCGDEDEKTYLEEMTAEGVDEEDMEVITLAEFEDDFPKYVHSPSKIIEAKALHKLATSNDPHVAEVARLLLSAPDCEAWEGNGRPEYQSELGGDSENIGYAAVMNWDADGSNITTRVTDDWIEYAYSGGCTDLFGVFRHDQTLEGVDRLFTDLDKYIAALTWTDKAISLLSDRTS